MLLGGSMELLQIGSRMVLLVYTEFLLCTLSALLHTHTQKKNEKEEEDDEEDEEEDEEEEERILHMVILIIKEY